MKNKKQKIYKALQGTISITSKGTGYVRVPDYEQDPEINFTDLNTALHGDIVEIITSDNEAAKKEIETKYNKEVTENHKVISFKVDKGNRFLISFIKEFQTPIKSINLRRPTLNDAFLKLTGRQIREEEASTRDLMKKRMQMHRRR